MNASTVGQLQMETLLNGPAGPPPDDTLPDFQKSAGLKTVFEVTLFLCFTLPTLALLLRIYTRHFVLRSMGYDDCKCLVVHSPCCLELLRC